MTEPRRLLDGGADPFATELLRSAVDDQPSSRAMHGTMAALGLATVSTTAAAASTIPAATKGVVGLKLSLVKWVGLATVGGGLLWGAAQLADSPTPPVAPLTVGEVAQGLADKAVESPLIQPADEQPADQEPAARADAAPETDPPADEEPPAAAPIAQGGSLSDEIAALDEVRQALNTSPAQALAALARYHARFPQGALSQEAQVLRIEALRRAGRAGEARSLARAFLARHPSSPLAQAYPRPVLRPVAAAIGIVLPAGVSPRGSVSMMRWWTLPQASPSRSTSS